LKFFQRDKTWGLKHFPRPSQVRELHAQILRLNGGNWFGFEPHVAALYRRILRAGAVALDGGANLGKHTVQMAAAVAPGGLVIALEPVPKLRAELERRLAVQKGSHKRSVRVLPLGLSDHLGESKFFQVTNEAQHELSGLVNRHWLRDYPVKEILVSLTTIDAVCANLERLDFIKLDIEGAEMDALRGGRKTVARFRSVIAFEQDQFSPQYFNYTWQDLVDYFDSLEYEVYDLFGCPYPDASMLSSCAVWDFVALPKEFRGKLEIFQALRRSMIDAGVRF
jgi:FkbM family methyltransferase